MTPEKRETQALLLRVQAHMRGRDNAAFHRDLKWKQLIGTILHLEEHHPEAITSMRVACLAYFEHVNSQGPSGLDRLRVC